MNERYKNPHPFDMSLYYSGEIVVIGGRDFESDDNEDSVQKSEILPTREVKIELDWALLLSNKQS